MEGEDGDGEDSKGGGGGDDDDDVIELLIIRDVEFEEDETFTIPIFLPSRMSYKIK